MSSCQIGRVWVPVLGLQAEVHLDRYAGRVLWRIGVTYLETRRDRAGCLEPNLVNFEAIVFTAWS